MYDDNEAVLAALRWLEETGGTTLEDFPLQWVAVGGDGPVRVGDTTVADEDPERVVGLLDQAGVSIEDVFLVFVQTAVIEG